MIVKSRRYRKRNKSRKTRKNKTPRRYKKQSRRRGGGEGEGEGETEEMHIVNEQPTGNDSVDGEISILRSAMEESWSDMNINYWVVKAVEDGSETSETIHREGNTHDTFMEKMEHYFKLKGEGKKVDIKENP